MWGIGELLEMLSAPSNQTKRRKVIHLHLQVTCGGMQVKIESKIVGLIFSFFSYLGLNEIKMVTTKVKAEWWENMEEMEIDVSVFSQISQI